MFEKLTRTINPFRPNTDRAHQLIVFVFQKVTVMHVHPTSIKLHLDATHFASLAIYDILESCFPWIWVIAALQIAL